MEFFHVGGELPVCFGDLRCRGVGAVGRERAWMCRGVVGGVGEGEVCRWGDGEGEMAVLAAATDRWDRHGIGV